MSDMGTQMNGRVKWWNDSKGYGFITDETGEDVFVHYSAIQMTGFHTLTEGEPVTFEKVRGPKGPQAANVRRGASQEPEEVPAPDDQLAGQELIAMALLGDKIKMVSLAPDGRYKFLDDAENLHTILYTWSSETLALQRAAEELEALMNDPRAQESAFQDFFERHPDLILNDEYKRAHPRIVLTDEKGYSLIPDFILEPVAQNAVCDLLELKLPSAPVFVLQKNRPRFSAAVLEACAQLREYSRFFDEEKNRKAIRDKYGLITFRPKMFVIIGRRGTVSPIDVRKIEGDLPNLQLRTYDELLNRVKTRIEAMKRGRRA